jgi:hypothetical protein
MRLYDLEESAQKGIMDSGQDDLPVFEKTTIGQRQRDMSKFNF